MENYYFIGIKGSGMSSLALLLNDLGHQVSGSDIGKYTFTQKGLEDRGIEIFPFDENNISPEVGTVIAGNAFDDDQIEIKKARKLGLEVKRYHDFLGDFINKQTSIGVAGAHGKTSTTGLLAHVLGGITQTSFLIGDGTGRGQKNSQFFVFEADEYRRHFLAYHPDYLIMTNIDFDHPDYFENIDDVFDAFNVAANQTKKYIVAWGDDPYLRKLQTKTPILYYGFNETDDVQAVNVIKTINGSAFDVIFKGELIGRFEIPLFGDHNILNSLAVISILHLEGMDSNDIAKELLTFKGVKRRFSEKKVSSMTIIDDYAHHPSEIDATIDAARQEHPNSELIAVFQPHTFSRTIALKDEFAKSLDHADHVFLTDIFGSAREQSGEITSLDLSEQIKNFRGIITEEDVSALLDYEDSVIVFMGAGDVQKYEYEYMDLLSNLQPRKS